MTEQKDTICKSLANILLQFLKIIFALIFLFLSFFFLIKNSPFVLEQKLITVENAEDNPEIFYELKNIETNAVIEFSEEKLTNLLSAFFLPKKISFADKENPQILVLKNYAFSPEEARAKNQELIDKMNTYLTQKNLAIKEDLITQAETKYNLAQRNLESIRYELEKLELQKHTPSKTNRQIQQSIITALKTELVRIETQIAQLKAISPNSHQLNALNIRKKNLNSELDLRNKKFIIEPEKPEELNLKNKLKMQEEIAEKAFKEAFLQKSLIEFEIKKRELKIKLLN